MIIVADDDSDPNRTVTLHSITSNEPDSGLGYGNTVNDVVIVDELNLQLRAERSALGTGRTYTMIYEVADACGNAIVASVTVVVPHDRGP